MGSSAAFRLTTEGTWERAESQSSQEIVTVRPKVILEYLPSVKRGEQLAITGTVLPRISGADVAIQVLSAGKWQSLPASAVSDTKGAFTISALQAKRGVVTMRVQVTNGAQPILSPEFSIVVR